MKLAPPPIRSQIVDNKGNLTSPWLQWVRNIYERVGGSDGGDAIDSLDYITDVSTPVCTDDQFQAPLAINLSDGIYGFDDARISAIEAELYELKNKINSLEQGKSLWP